MAAWRGVTLDQRSADMMDEVARLCPGVPITPTQGSWSGADASAGTHSACGAIDVAAEALSGSERDQIVHMMRAVGWAAWLRTPAQSSWPFHIHGIAVQPGGKHDRGCLSAAAHDQVIDYYEGRNGLANNAPDDGPREFVGTTWESYQQDDEEVGAMYPVIMFNDGKSVSECDVLAGTWRRFGSEKDLADRRHVLASAGVKVLDWDGTVANPDAFGVEVG